MSAHDRHTPTRLIGPLGMRVLVRVIRPDERTQAGLYLPANVKDDAVAAAYGEVIEVARAGEQDPMEVEGGANVSGIPNGSRVLFAPEAGFRVPWDDQLRLVHAKDVLAIVEEILPEATH